MGHVSFRVAVRSERDSHRLWDSPGFSPILGGDLGSKVARLKDWGFFGLFDVSKSVPSQQVGFPTCFVFGDVSAPVRATGPEIIFTCHSSEGSLWQPPKEAVDFRALTEDLWSQKVKK